MKSRETELKLIAARLWYALMLSIAAIFPQAAAGTITNANWTPVGPGMKGSVFALAVLGTNLYAGGAFTNAGGSNYVARWDGSSWTQVGAGMDGAVRALAVVGSNLYAGGSFTVVGDRYYFHIARWDGTFWWGLSGGVDCDVYALAVSGTNLYVGGCFTTAIGTVNHIARWNGYSWAALGPGLTNSTGAGAVNALAVSGSDVYAGGTFTRAGSTVVNYIAKWDGSSWSALGSGVGSGILRNVDALAVSGSELYAGGLFSWATNSGGVSVTVSNIAKWSGGAWTNLGSGLMVNLGANALAVSGNDLYVGGSFQLAGGHAASAIAKWDGTNWTPLGSGLTGANPPSAYALAILGNDLYVGGAFTNGGGKASARIARVYLGTVPALSVGGSGLDAMVSWPSVDTQDFTLEQTSTLTLGANWVSNTATIADDGTNKSVTIPATNPAQFFRLRRP